MNHQNKTRFIDTENKLEIIRGEGGWGWWVKWAKESKGTNFHNQDLLYTIGNYTQYFVITIREKNLKKIVCVYN